MENTNHNSRTYSEAVAIGCDHAGFIYKKALKDTLPYKFLDCGTYSDDRCDYPDIAKNVVEKIRNNECQRGILICGSGIGMCIAANKFPGIRAAICHDSFSAHQGVEHDHINVLCLGEQCVGIEVCKEIVEKFIEANELDDSDYHRRVLKIIALENKIALGQW